MSALLSGKIDKYEYITGEGIRPSDQKRVIEQPKFTYSPLEKTFEKETKTNEGQNKKKNNNNNSNNNKKQIKTIEDHGKQLVELNALISRNDFNIAGHGIPFEKQNEIFN